MKRKHPDIEQGDTGEWFLGIATSEGEALGAPTRPPGRGVETGPAPSSPDLPRPGARDTPASWDDRAFARSLDSTRRFRWPTVAVVAGLLVAVLVAVTVWVPSLPRRRADTIARSYTSALHDLRATIPGAFDALDLVADPSQPVSDLAATVPAIAALDGAGAGADLLAREPLPSIPPPLPDSPIEDLEPARRALGVVGSDATTVARRLNAALAYRALVTRLFTLGSLPVEATPDRANALSVELASALADAVGIATDLSSDPVFDAHRGRVDVAVARFETWQVEYLETLRRDDAAAALDLIEELAALRAGLTADLADPLVALYTESEQALLELEANIADVEYLLDR